MSDDQVLTLDGLPFDLRGYNWDVNLVNTHTSLVEKDSEYTDHGDSTMGEDQPWFTDLLHLLIEHSLHLPVLSSFCEEGQVSLSTTLTRYCCFSCHACRVSENFSYREDFSLDLGDMFSTSF